MMLRCGISVEELLYPVDTPGPGAWRFGRGTGLPPPPIAQVTLPHLSVRPDDLFRRIGRAAVRLPRQRLSDHFRWLFGALAEDPARHRGGGIGWVPCVRCAAAPDVPPRPGSCICIATAASARCR